jgi:hypothetical protein
MFIFLVPNDLFDLWHRPQSFSFGNKQKAFNKLTEKQQLEVSSLDQYVMELQVDLWVMSAERRAADAETEAKAKAEEVK